MSNPFSDDVFVTQEAEKRGLEVYRRTVIEIDPELLPQRYYRATPDYNKIRRSLDDGVSVPGATLTTKVEYIVRERDGNGEAA